MTAQYVVLHKWQKNLDDTWGLWDEEIPILDVAAWEHNGWTRDIPEKPIEEPVTVSRSRKTVEAT